MTALAQVPGLCEDLLSSVDQPLKISRDKTTGKDYLLCDYNRDGDSYRCIQHLPPPSLALSLSLSLSLSDSLFSSFLFRTLNPCTLVLMVAVIVYKTSICHYIFRIVFNNQPQYTCRSPWSNKYDPPLPDGAVPSDRLRRLEVEANQAFDTYREL